MEPFKDKGRCVEVCLEESLGEGVEGVFNNQFNDSFKLKLK